MKRPKHITKFKNIRVTQHGYQVVIVRAKVEISRFFSGHTRESLRAAEECRDQILAEAPGKRLNEVPARILKELNLARPVVGVFRHPDRFHYAVGYTDKGNKRSRAFSWRDESESKAYAKAIKFRDSVVKSK